MLMLPTMEALQPLFQWFSGFIMDLPEPIQLFIGVLITVIGVLGKVIFIVGTLALGLGALSFVLGLLNLSLLPVIAIILGVVVVITVVILIIKNWGSIIEWIKTVWTKFKNFLSGLFDKIKVMFKNIWDKFVPDIFKKAILTYFGMWKKVIDFFKNFGITIKNIFSGMWDGIKSTFNNFTGGIKTMITNLANKIWNALPDWLQKIVGGIAGGVSSIVKGAKNLFGGSDERDDFIMRPGQRSVKINPNDTLVGFKGKPPNLGSGGGVQIIQNITVSSKDKMEMERMFRENNKKLVNYLKQLNNQTNK
jgi:hypothetical protein